MSFGHNQHARAIRQTLPSTKRQLEFEVRTGKRPALAARELIAALEDCAAHHEALALEQRRRERNDSATHAEAGR
ncbi:hypothetical protein [Algiphilus sp.]|uniref:hypothetical protein n=1 Tax=Algiphilus sp. TaxID=1872431 RepID=UPI0025B994E7|nr:hypothetical protein [Algiphilus sp.]MCK5770909.1 hypothetical protein [Algiphilus sp.]